MPVPPDLFLWGQGSDSAGPAPPWGLTFRKGGVDGGDDVARMLTETQNRGGRCIYTFSENPREDLGEVNENIKSTYLWEVTFFLFLPHIFSVSSFSAVS